MYTVLQCIVQCSPYDFCLVFVLGHYSVKYVTSLDFRYGLNDVLRFKYTSIKFKICLGGHQRQRFKILNIILHMKLYALNIPDFRLSVSMMLIIIVAAGSIGINCINAINRNKYKCVPAKYCSVNIIMNE